MSCNSNRVSRDDVASAVAQAVALEGRRIEQIAPGMVDQVTGGNSGDPTVTTNGVGGWGSVATAGWIEPQMIPTI